MTTTTTQPPLSEQQLHFFDREGYLIVEDLLSEADLQPAIDEIEEEVDRLAHKALAEGKITDLHAEADFAHRLALLSEQYQEIAQPIWSGSLAGPAFFHLIRNPRMLAMAEQFCGPEIIASAVYRLRPKLPSYGRGEVPWHQDSGYVEPYCEQHMMLTAWLPLVDADEENGCMWIIPRAHKRGILEHAKRKRGGYLTIPQDTLPDERDAIPARCRKGGVVLMHSLTPHASFANRTNRVRWSMDLRYQNAALPTNAPITRLEGEIGSGAPDAPPACYPPEADCLVKSDRRPGEVVQNPDRFHEIRTRHIKQPVSRIWQRVVDE